MKTVTKKVLSLLLCAALICGFAVMPQANAHASETIQSGDMGDHVVYGTEGQTTFVPAGYTYIFEQENGQTISQYHNVDTYVYQRTLTAEEIQQLEALESSEAGYTVDANGQMLVQREYSAAEAMSNAEAVKAILGLDQIEMPRNVSEDTKVLVQAEVYAPTAPVRALITFEQQPVIRMEGMAVTLGTGLGEQETQASRNIKAQQLTAMAKVERTLGYEVQLHGQYSLLTNAVSATVNYGDLATIARMPGVKSAILMPTYEVPETETQIWSEDVVMTPNMKYTAPGMGANLAWDVGYKGEGMSVAIIDTGIALVNPAFEIEPTNPDTVAFSREDIEHILATEELNAEVFCADTTIDTVYYSSKIPFGFNYADNVADFGDDVYWQGHGSHVSGIVAGNIPEDIKEKSGLDSMGIAPEAQLINMNVFGSSSGASMDSIVAAMEDTIILGVDCANLSLGYPVGPAYWEGVTEVYDAAVEAGINVVVAAGNDGHSGLNSLWGEDMVKTDSVSTGTLGMPGTFDSVLTVASAENSHSYNVDFANGNQLLSWWSETYNQRLGISYFEIPGVPEGEGFWENLRGQSLGYTESLRDAEGKLLFQEFEGGNADQMIADAADAGAAGLVLVLELSEDEEEINISATSFDCPAAFTTADYYADMQNQEIKDGLIRVDDEWNPTGMEGEMSSFSSWGPTETLNLKPEITGIGGNVFSAYYDAYFAIASGTSMASPTIAASAALVRQYLRENELVADDELNRVVNSLLMSTATPLFDEEHGTHYFVRRQGAGLANIGAAINSGAYIAVEGESKPKLELGDDPAKTGVYEMTFSVVNFDDTDKTYTLDTSVLGQKAVGGLYKFGEAIHLTFDYARELDSVVTSSLKDNTVTVPAGESVEITVTVALTDAEKTYYDERFPAGAYVEGFIQLLSEETPSLVVPFLGFYGNFEDGPMLELHGYETLLMGPEMSFSSADQFTPALWSTKYEMHFDNDTGHDVNDETAYKWYMGDTDFPMYERVPMEYYDKSTMSDWATVFVPELAGFSPNGDFVQDDFNFGFALRRNAENIHYTVTNRVTGEVLMEQDTGFVSKTYSRDSYAGREMDMRWLYEWEEWDGTIYYSRNKIILEDGTWVEIRADITPEGQTEPTESISFPVYIDNTAPDTKYTFTNKDYYGSPYYFFQANTAENYFMDYQLHVMLQQNERGAYGTFMWNVYNYRSGTAGVTTDSWLQLGGDFDPEWYGNHQYFHFAQDCAGNATGIEFSWNAEDLDSYVELSAEKTEIMVGDTVTIENTVVLPENVTMPTNWEVSDPTIAEIVETTDNTITIRGLSRGAVTVYGGSIAWMEGVEIWVEDPAFLELKDKFVDVPGHWAEDEILESVWQGLFEGTGKDTFSPNADLTRAQLVTVLYRMAGTPEVTADSSFTDVPADTWYTDAVAWGQETGIVKGMTADTFAPNAPVSRQQFATFLYRYAEFAGEDVTARADLSLFADAGSIQDYAVDAMGWAVAVGLIQGMDETTLSPATTANRAQAATILVRYLQK